MLSTGILLRSFDLEGKRLTANGKAWHKSHPLTKPLDTKIDLIH